MTKKNNLLYYIGFIWIVTILVPLAAAALDNPDAPDYMGEFNDRSKPYIEAIDNPKNSSRDYLIAYDNYANFLDSELNSAFKLLKSKLANPQQEELKLAQRQWIKFRDSEFMLISNNWTKENFGSSSGISRGSYRCTIIKDRVIQLLNYLKNY